MRFAEFIGIAKNDVVGVDICADSVKVIELHRRGSGYSVAAAARVEIDQNGDSEQDPWVSTIATIRKCIEASGTKAAHAITSVSGTNTAIRSFTFPVMPEEEVGYAVLLEAEQVSGHDMNNSVVDYQLSDVDVDNEKISGMLVTANAEAIQIRQEMIKSANLQGVLMDVDCMAIMNCFSKFGENNGDSTFAILDIEKKYTNLIILHDQTMPFVRNLPHGGSRIIDRICTEQKTESATTSTVRDSFEKTGKKLTTEISKTLRYYMTHERKCRIEKVYICGEFALVNGMDKLLGDDLRREVTVWNPFKDIHFSSSVKEREQLFKDGPSMATAMGLAMRTI